MGVKSCPLCNGTKGTSEWVEGKGYVFKACVRLRRQGDSEGRLG